VQYVYELSEDIMPTCSVLRNKFMKKANKSKLQGEHSVYFARWILKTNAVLKKKKRIPQITDYRESHPKREHS
jgi:hypothetical protein